MIKMDSISEFTHYRDEAHLKYEIIRPVLLEEVEKEYTKYEEARKAAVGDQGVKEAEKRDTRGKMGDTAVEVYLGMGKYFEKDVLRCAEQIRKLDDGITASQLAEHQLDFGFY